MGLLSGLGLRLRPAAALLLLAAPARAQEPQEYAVKGVYLFKFADYVEWPAGTFPPPGTPFVIGILGDDPFGASLDEAVRGRTVQGRPLEVRRFRRPEEVAGAQVLFMAPSEEARWGRWAGGRARGVLTVADRPDGSGAVIAFVLEGRKVRFQVDLDAAERAGLKISSKLLSLAAPRYARSGGEP